jgi:hypothetical protein
MEKDKEKKKMTLGIGSLTNLVKEIREDVPKNPITINENTNCEEWTHFFCTTLDKYGKGSAKAAVVYIPQELKNELENLRNIMGGKPNLSSIVSAVIDTFIERNLPIIKDLSKEKKKVDFKTII